MNKSGNNISVRGFKSETEKLLDHFMGVKVDLLKRERDKADIILEVKGLLITHRIASKVVDIIVATHNVHQNTAYKYIRQTEQIFGKFNKAVKEFKRIIAEEMLLETRRICIAKKDTKGLNSNDANYIKLFGLDKEDPDIPNYEEIQFHQNIIAFIPEQMSENPPDEDELMLKANEMLDKLANEAIDVDYEEVNNK